MQQIMKTLEWLSSITDLPFSLLDGEGRLLEAWPTYAKVDVPKQYGVAVLADFHQKQRDTEHPLISFLDPGFLIGVMELPGALYVLIGLVSPYVHSRAEVLKLVGEIVLPAHLPKYYEQLLRQPLVPLEKLKALICLTSRLLGAGVAAESILFVDNASGQKLGVSELDQSLFEQREEPDSHVPVDFETAICAAVETGDRVMLERSLFAPHPGRIGRMSANELRQQKYAFISMATLCSRAAIRGGLSEETAFSLSDLYCQRADLLAEIPLIQNLTFTMLMDYCGKVREIRRRPNTSPMIGKCLDYISVHLHETIDVGQLSRYCGLCTRSLSLRFKEEIGLGIPEYVHREKLREAEYLLRHTDYSLSEIASFLNYSSQSYFTQIFKKLRGQTPQKFRDGRTMGEGPGR